MMKQGTNNIINNGHGIIHAKAFTSKGRIFTVSNIITASRLLLLPFIVYFLLVDKRITAFIIMLISLLSDTVDGYLARKFNQVTEAGKFLDPLCDKISLAVILITLYFVKSIPLWGIIVIVLRDILILAGSFVLMTYKAQIFKSNTVGKITGALFGAVICAYTLKLSTLGEVLLYISIPLIIISFIIYLRRYIQAMKGEK